jgi:predicted ribosome quality control (RQC) complex YloA/Tae2 family protein
VLSNYYTLRAVTQEISGALKDSRCASIYCFRKDELRLHFSNGATVVALLRPVQGALYVSRNVERLPKKNVVTFFPELTDATVMAALISPTDREITMQFEHHELRLTFFGTPNALLIKDGEVIRSFKKSHNNDAKPDKERTARSDSGLDLLGKRLRKEYDASLSMNAENQFLKHLEHAKGAWIYDLHGQLLLSSIELTQDVSTDAPRHFESTSEAIRVVLAERERRGKFEDAAQEIIPKLKQSLDRTNRVLAEITRAETHTSRAEESLEIGKAILSALHTIERGASTVMLYLIAGEREIKLDPKLSAAENAERYFDRAHRSKSAQKELAERRTRLEEERAKRYTNSNRNLHDDLARAFLTIHAKILRTSKIRSRDFGSSPLPGAYVFWLGRVPRRMTT